MHPASGFLLRALRYRSSGPARCVFALFVGLGLLACSASSGGTSGSGSATSSGAGSSGSSSSGAAGDDCETLCTTEASLHCAGSDAGVSSCVSGCELTKTEITWCASTATAAADCLAKQPASSFECTSTGAAAKSTVCASEIEANVSCYYVGPSSGLPDLTSECTAVCQTKSSLSCADPSCVSGCEASVKSGVKCNGAFGALVACAAKLPASDFACDANDQANLKAGLCPFETYLLDSCYGG